jgi:hypothetical protein
LSFTDKKAVNLSQNVAEQTFVTGRDPYLAGVCGFVTSIFYVGEQKDNERSGDILGQNVICYILT